MNSPPLHRGPPPTAALLTQAIALHQQGALAAAEALYRRVLVATPKDPNALHLLGVLTAQAGRPEEAIALIGAAIAETPNEALFHANLGRAYKAAGRPADSLARFDRAIALGSTDPGVFNDRGNALRDLGHPQAALASLDRAVALRPNYAEAFSNRGNALLDLDRPHDALASYDRAIAMRPDDADTLSSRGKVLVDLHRHQEAADSYGQAIALRPGQADALSNRAVVLTLLGQYTAALQSYDQALAQHPDHLDARLGRSLCLLKLGDLSRGWPDYEARWRTPQLAPLAAKFASPPWLGAENLAGKTILARAEQGFGDTLQFCRYLPLLAARGARVVLAVPRPLLRLLATLGGVAALLSEGDPIPAHDLHCPLMSLPLAFATTLETIPPPARLTPPPARVTHWRQRLTPLARPHVGLCWAGGFRPDDPAAQAIDRRRSTTLAHHAKLAAVAGPSFMSLQKGEPAAQAANPPAGLALHDWTDELHDFADTAALIEALDLVITVDTAIAHLAATLGKPTWILNRHDACWRWLLGRNDSPWYPTARLFHQPTQGDWPTVIDAVATALRSFAHA